MTTVTMNPRVTSFAPQFLVDDLERSIAYYRKLGFFGEPWGGFYAIGNLDGLELHLKEAPKNQAERRHRRDNEHLDASAGVEGIEAFYERCIANGATTFKPLPDRTAVGSEPEKLTESRPVSPTVPQTREHPPGRGRGVARRLRHRLRCDRTGGVRA